MESNTVISSEKYFGFDPKDIKRAPKDRDELNKMVRPSLTYWQDAWIKLRRNPMATIGLVILVVYILMAIFVPMLSKYDYATQNSAEMNLPPSAGHLFGTDQAGRDLWVRNWMGARVSLSIGILVVLMNTAIGCVVGGIAGYFGGRTDMVIMHIIDVIYGIPSLIIAILIRTVWPQGGIFSLIIAMCIVGWIGSARLVRGQILQLKNMEYVMASRVLGASDKRIILRHMIPNISGLIITNMTMAIPKVIFDEAFLSFLCIGVQPPMCSWGTLAQTAVQVYRVYPYQLIIPAFFICTTMLSINMLGDGMRDALDPKTRGKY